MTSPERYFPSGGFASNQPRLARSCPPSFLAFIVLGINPPNTPVSQLPHTPPCWPLFASSSCSLAAFSLAERTSSRVGGAGGGASLVINGPTNLLGTAFHHPKSLHHPFPRSASGSPEVPSTQNRTLMTSRFVDGSTSMDCVGPRWRRSLVDAVAEDPPWKESGGWRMVSSEGEVERWVESEDIRFVGDVDPASSDTML